MICATCCALEFAPDDQLRALVAWQAKQIDRLTGGSYKQPDPAALVDDRPATPQPAPDVLAVLEATLWEPDIFRRPPRTAAPRLVERLAAAGIHVTRNGPSQEAT